jgi:hypothetical protein
MEDQIKGVLWISQKKRKSWYQSGKERKKERNNKRTGK